MGYAGIGTAIAGGDFERKTQGLIEWNGTDPTGPQPRTIATFVEGELRPGDAVQVIVEHRAPASLSHGDPDNKYWDSTFWDEAHLEDGEGNRLQQHISQSFSTGRFTYLIREYSGQALVIQEENNPFTPTSYDGLWMHSTIRQPNVESGFMTGAWSLVYSANEYVAGHPTYAYYRVNVIRAKQGE